jgi:lysophospholipase L1-like esterase
MSKQWLRALIIAGLSCIGIATNAVRAVGAPRYPLMIGLGDSISAAALADTSTQKEWSFPWGLPFPSIDNPIDQIGGFKSDFENKRTLSWVSGIAIQSHYKRLRKIYEAQGKNLWVLNFAVTGSVSSEVIDQVDEIDTALKFGLFNSVPYITLLVGANDLCKSVPVDTFHKNVRSIFEKIASIRPKDGQPIRILVSAIPMIPDLGQENVLEYRTAAGYRCRIIRNLRFSYCKSMTQWKSEEERQHLVTLVNQVNDILRTETLEASRRFPQLQTFFSPTLAERKVDPTDLAMDCFHPNQSGQEKIAEELWAEQPWFH